MSHMKSFFSPIHSMILYGALLSDSIWKIEQAGRSHSRHHVLKERLFTFYLCIILANINLTGNFPVYEDKVRFLRMYTD